MAYEKCFARYFGVNSWRYPECSPDAGGSFLLHAQAQLPIEEPTIPSNCCTDLVSAPTIRPC